MTKRLTVGVIRCGLIAPVMRLHYLRELREQYEIAALCDVPDDVRSATVPGDGSIAYAPLLRRLADYGYRGWLVVEAEQDPRKAHPLTYASMGHRNLRSMAMAAGFRVIDPPQVSG
jgi:sugar phosphate isomerase/epimerase